MMNKGYSIPSNQLKSAEGIWSITNRFTCLPDFQEE